MDDLLLMCPGPTIVHDEVRAALARPATNADLDPAFLDDYGRLCARLGTLLGTASDVLVLCGEGILGLEASCASLVQPGDRVLILENGVFGRGFGDFVEMYGGEAVRFASDDREPFDAEALAAFLAEDDRFVLATMVHCETPAGLLNPLADMCRVLKEHGILTVVDAVSSVGGVPVDVDSWGVDVCLGGSQKALSAPPGLTFLSISDEAWGVVAGRTAPIRSFYANLGLWRRWRQDGAFPYTMPAADLAALAVAVERALADGDRIARHARIGAACRAAVTGGGLQLYARSGQSDTVTAVVLPEPVDEGELLGLLRREYRIVLGGTVGLTDARVVRVGHMGEGCRGELVWRALHDLDGALRRLGVPPRKPLHRLFEAALDE